MATSDSTPKQLPLPVEGATVEITLTKGFYAIVDAIDADLAQYKWRASNLRQSTYGVREIGKRPNRSNQLLHRVIFERVLGRRLLKSEEVDHVDGDGCNNRRSNLRLASRSQNSKNRKRNSDNTSGYKGVSKAGNKWRAVITTNHETKHLGCFSTPEQAYEAYCEAAKKYHSEFARLE